MLHLLTGLYKEQESQCEVTNWKNSYLHSQSN
jgi:hypothetical protein